MNGSSTATASSDVQSGALDPLELAAIAARALLGHHSVQEVWLFGSLSRGTGTAASDCDMIVVVNPDDYTIYAASLDGRGGYGWSADRRHLACETLRIDPASLRPNGFRKGLDLIVVPTDWRNQLGRLQRDGAHDDPEFMWKIALDARRYDPETGTFLERL